VALFTIYVSSCVVHFATGVGLGIMGARSVDCVQIGTTESHMQTPIIYKLGFNQNYYTFTLMLLIKIVLCSKFP